MEYQSDIQCHFLRAFYRCVSAYDVAKFTISSENSVGLELTEISLSINSVYLSIDSGLFLSYFGAFF